MPEWISSLLKGWPMISANWPLFLVLIALIVGALWTALSWAFGSVIRKQAAEIKLLERQISSENLATPHPELSNRAELRLHIYGDHRLPDRISAENIWRWFYMHDVLVLHNIDGSIKSEIVTAKLFVSFDQPVAVGTMRVRSDKPLNRYEIKEFNNRFAIIHFGEVPVESNIDIQVSV